MENEEKLVSFIDEQLAKCNKDAYELQAYINISYFAGKQWIKVDHANNRLIDMEHEPWQVRLVANKIQPIVRTEQAKITRNKFSMYVNPATSEDPDIKAARVAEKVIEWLEYDLSLQEKDRENCLWGLCTGISFMKPFWNPNKGEDFTDERGKTMHVGDVDCCVVSLFELKFDTSCTKWEDITWVCHEKIRTVDYVKKTYGLDVSPEEGLAMTNLYEAKLQTLASSGEGITYQTRKDSVVVHEYWELPSEEYPRGRRITKIGNKIAVNEKDIGFGEEDDSPRELPFFPFCHINVPGRLFPTCVVEQLVPLQREYNRSRSKIIENINLNGNPILMYPEGCLDDEPTNEPGQILVYNPGQGKPDYLTPPTMGADIYRSIDYLEKEIEFTSGQHETSHGTTPTGVTSGTAIGYLQEQDDTKLGPTTANFIDCKWKYMRYLLKMVQKNYSHNRTIRIAGENRRVETETFKGADLTSIDVRVQAGTMYQVSKAAMQDFTMKMIQYGLLLPNNERDRSFIMKVLEFGIMDDVYSEHEQDSAHAQTENDKFRVMDISPDVREFYNHEAHVKEHNKFRKSEAYVQLPDEVKQAIDAHVQQHLEFLAQQMLGMAQMQPQMQQPQVKPQVKPPAQPNSQPVI